MSMLAFVLGIGVGWAIRRLVEWELDRRRPTLRVVDLTERRYPSA